MINIGVLGHLGIGKNLFDGQTVKTREIVDELSRHNELTVHCYDTYYMKRNPIKFIKNLMLLFLHNDKVVICLSWNGYHKILPIIVLFNSVFKLEIFDFVIGGSRHLQLNNSKFYCWLENFLTKIYVESPTMEVAYKNLNLKQTEYLPNFKTLQIVNNVGDCYQSSELPLKVCTFSRICKEKGVEDAIAAVTKVNELNKKVVYELTIYGKPDSGYKKRFEEIRLNFPSYIKFGGLVPYDETTEVLKKYFLLLFPTYHTGEGFPGTLIDAFTAGLPSVVTDWNCNKEIIEDGKTGFVVPVNDVNAFAEKMIYCSDHLDEINLMRKNCLTKAKDYMTCNVLKNFINEII